MDVRHRNARQVPQSQRTHPVPGRGACRTSGLTCAHGCVRNRNVPRLRRRVRADDARPHPRAHRPRAIGRRTPSANMSRLGTSGAGAQRPSGTDRAETPGRSPGLPDVVLADQRLAQSDERSSCDAHRTKSDERPAHAVRLILSGRRPSVRRPDRTGGDGAGASGRWTQPRAFSSETAWDFVPESASSSRSQRSHTAVCAVIS